MGLIKIAVTGGPCAGKTSVMDSVKKYFGDQVLSMPEVASILFRGGYPYRNKPDWAERFQRCILTVQDNMEHEYSQKALEQISRVVLFDRGMLDGAAYLEMDTSEYLEMFNLDRNQIYSRYDAVLHLESVAVRNKALYDKLKSTNPGRYETAEQAAHRDMTIKRAWSGYENWHCIEGDLGMEYVTTSVISFLSQFLNTEIESKFLLHSLPKVELGQGVSMRQGYLKTSTGEVRLRQMGENYYITIKSDGSSSRMECERSIDKWAFDQLWKDTEGRTIHKTRYFINYRDLTLELDVYEGKLQGLITLECEFSSQDEQLDFRLPSYVGVAHDITHDPNYKNKNLAASGLPDID